jgi:hypothetical protein
MPTKDLLHTIRQKLMVVSGRAELLLIRAQNDSDRASCEAIRDAAFAIDALLHHCDQIAKAAPERSASPCALSSIGVS